MSGSLALMLRYAQINKRVAAQADLVSLQFIQEHCTRLIGHPVDQSASSTFTIVGQDDFNISYVDGTGSTGSYFEDTFSIGGATLQNFQMGLATDTTIGTGIMGIGYETSEANTQTGTGSTYPNLPVAMVSAGLINSNAYSLWLNDLGKSNGTVLGLGGGANIL
jgi:hypothetical protein